MMFDLRTSTRSTRAAARAVVAVISAGSRASGCAAFGVADGASGDDPDGDAAVSMRAGAASSSAGATRNGNGDAGSSPGGSPATLESEAAPEVDYSAVPAEAAPADGSHLGLKA